jgi:acyl CoA:acetate/3-ketoacid CoA transferase beta subunit
MSDYTLDELMCALMAREIRDTDWVNHGAVVPLAGAALMLAKQTHAPRADFFYLGTHFNSVNPTALNLMDMWADPRLAYTSSKCLISHADILNWTIRGGCTLQFLRPLQMDRFGSVNVSVIGDPAAPKYRFHGIAVADVMVTCERPIVYTTEHNERTFPAELSFRTGLGHTDGDGWRRLIRAPGGGPYRVITPLATLDFETEDGGARLRALNPGVEVEEVVANTGFDLEVPDEVERNPAPTAEELRVLREVVDPVGIRQTEFKETRAAANQRIAAELARRAAAAEA